MAAIRSVDPVEVDESLLAQVRLACVPGVGSRLRQRLLARFGSPQAVFAAGAAELADGPSVRVGFGNFRVITRYNRSIRYAMAVHDLAEAIRARAAEQVAAASRVEGIATTVGVP